jgi:hypothetical protein
MTDFERKIGQFKGWSEHKRRRPLMKNLMDLIVDVRPLVVGSVISVSDFNSIDWRVEFPNLEPIQDVYHLALQNVLRFTLVASEDQTMPEMNGDKIGVVISQNREFGGAAANYYLAFAEIWGQGKFVKAAVFGEPREFPQLQAADIAAFELRWRFMMPPITRYPLTRLLEIGRMSVSVRGVHPLPLAGVGTIEEDTVRPIVLERSDSKRVRNQGKRSRRKPGA